MSKIIAYTGLEHSGRTTVILNKAYILAKEGYKVLIVDADQTRGRIRASINIAKNEKGLEEAVTSLDENVYSKCFIYDKKTKLTFLTLPITAKCENLFLLTFDQAEKFFQKIRKEFDFILIDCGSIFYEALSSVALFEADKIYLILSPEKRASIWLDSVKSILLNFNQTQNSIENIIVNLMESPEIPQEQVYEGKYIEVPYIQNMRDYSALGEMFVQSPTGRKAKEYVNVMKKLASSVKE